MTEIPCGMWFTVFLLIVLSLALLGRQEDRPVWAIVALATVASMAMEQAWLASVDAAWKLVPVAALEVVTIVALFGWAWTPLGRAQAIALSVAWAAHVLLYVDIVTGWSLIYDHYEQIILGVAVVQLALGYESYRHLLRALMAYLSVEDGLPGVRPICGAGLVSHRHHHAAPPPRSAILPTPRS